MAATIYYHPEAYTTSGPKLMARNAADESFLRGYLAYSRAQHFAQAVRASGRSEPPPLSQVSPKIARPSSSEPWRGL